MSAPHAPPAVYAREKLSQLRTRWNGAAGEAARELLPALWPGVPPAALIGLGASSTGPHERVGPPYYETGWYGIEGAVLDAWLADDARRAALARRIGEAAPRTVAEYQNNVRAQTVWGVENYLRHLAELHVPAGLVPSPGTCWQARLAVGAYITGGGMVAGLLRHYERALSAVQAAGRWALLGTLLAEDLTRGATTAGAVPIAGRWHGAATVVRVEQRLASGRLLAVDQRLPVTWWDEPLPEAVGRTLAAVTGSSGASSSAASDGSGAEWLLVPPLAWAMWKLWNGGW